VQEQPEGVLRLVTRSSMAGCPISGGFIARCGPIDG
jgi:hypothetical protein